MLRQLGTLADGSEAVSIADCKVQPAQLAGLVKLVDDGYISKQIAQNVLVEMFATGSSAIEIIEKKGLKPTDSSELEGICREVIEANPKPANEFREGKEKAINALKGQVMRATRGKANPQAVDQLLRQLLTS